LFTGDTPNKLIEDVTKCPKSRFIQLYSCTTEKLLYLQSKANWGNIPIRQQLIEVLMSPFVANKNPNASENNHN
jgi:hypothetical protein